jgi:hypothetical protein
MFIIVSLKEEAGKRGSLDNPPRAAWFVIAQSGSEDVVWPHASFPITAAIHVRRPEIAYLKSWL